MTGPNGSAWPLAAMNSAAVRMISSDRASHSWLVCPHAVIRAKVYGAERLAEAPAAFKSAIALGKSLALPLSIEPLSPPPRIAVTVA